ncbi:MAG TPA: NAD-dependent deacylase [Acidisarcina sp.]|nr:NAD-dependent deacylase [Acidisarcina sp.]
MNQQLARGVAPDAIEVRPTDRVFVLTGAGISAESGLKTFRDGNGLWAGYRVETVATPEGWEANPELVWQFYSERRKEAQASQPNAAHHALAELEEKIGDRLFLCTQNVDDLHERAGSQNMVHMHGELFQSRCEAECGAPVIADHNCYESLGEIPRCACGARLRPHIVWFGEIPLEMARIQQEIDRCSILLVVGTSGAVYPAASFVHWANMRSGDPVRTYYVGPEEPMNAKAFTQILLGKAGEKMPGLFRVL